MATAPKYQNYVQSASNLYGVPVNLINAVIQQESGFNASAVSSAGAVGVMQLMPSTAASLGVGNPYNAQQNIMGGTKYLSQLIHQNNGSIPLALAAYNAGQGNVNKYGGIPPFAETQNYVKNIMANYGGGNIDSTVSTATDTGFSLGSSIVNGIQDIFKTMFEDTTKLVIYIILFFVFVFFGYQALKGSPTASSAINGTKKTAKTAATVAKMVVK